MGTSGNFLATPLPVKDFYQGSCANYVIVVFFRYLLALAQSCGSDLINTCSMFVLLKFTHFGWG